MRATIDTISTVRAIEFTRQLARPWRAITLPSVGMEALAFRASSRHLLAPRRRCHWD